MLFNVSDFDVYTLQLFDFHHKHIELFDVTEKFLLLGNQPFFCALQPRNGGVRLGKLQSQRRMNGVNIIRGVGACSLCLPNSVRA